MKSAIKLFSFTEHCKYIEQERSYVPEAEIELGDNKGTKKSYSLRVEEGQLNVQEEKVGALQYIPRRPSAETTHLTHFSYIFTFVHLEIFLL